MQKLFTVAALGLARESLALEEIVRKAYSDTLSYDDIAYTAEFVYTINSEWKHVRICNPDCEDQLVQQDTHRAQLDLLDFEVEDPEPIKIHLKSEFCF